MLKRRTNVALEDNGFDKMRNKVKITVSDNVEIFDYDENGYEIGSGFYTVGTLSTSGEVIFVSTFRMNVEDEPNPNERITLATNKLIDSFNRWSNEPEKKRNHEHS